MDLKEAVLQRVDLVELIGQYTALQNAGREWRGRCPFHQEKTASFYVNPEKGVYHCYGCKAGGNAIGFVMALENLEFRDALEWLARRYNVEVPAEQRGRGFASGEKQRLYELNEAAAEFFRKQLRSTAGEAAREYLKGRGVDGATAGDFDLGYAPREWGALTDMLLSRGARASELVQLSLIRPRDGGGHYDYFRHRLIFPIRDVTGRVIGFAGRSLSAEDQPKYLNVANTPLYDKSRVLYNLDRAKGRLRDDGAVLVEGYMDVIGLAQGGVLNAVACCGTALTEQHVLLLQRYSDRFYLAFDGDEAGRRAAWTSGVLFLRHGYSPAVVMLQGADPDEYIRQNGNDAWLALLNDAAHVVEIWLAHQLEKHPQASTAQRHKWVLELAALYRALPNELIRQDYFRAVVNALGMNEQEVHGLLTSGAPAAPAPRRGAMKAAIGAEAHRRVMLAGAQPIEREVVRRLLLDGEFRYYYTALADAAWFEHAQLRALYSLLATGTAPDALSSDPLHSRLVSEILLAEPLADSGEQLLLRHSNLHLEREVARLTTEFRRAAAAGDTQREDALHREIVALKRQIRPVRGLEALGQAPAAPEEA